MVKAAEEIKLVRENLALSIALWRSAKNGKINPAELLGVEVAHNDSGRSQRAIDQEKADQLTRCAANQIRASFALSVLQTQRSLDSVFSGEPLDEGVPDLQAARCAVFLLNTALARNIFLPVWDCPPRHRRVYEVRPVRFALDATNVHGQSVSWGHFGGLERYLFLLDYCAAWTESALTKHPVEEQRSDEAEEGPDESKTREPRMIGASKLNGAITNGATTSGATTSGATTSGATTSGAATDEVAAEGTADRSPMERVPPDAADPVGLFVSARCQMGQGFRSLAKDLYASYVDWCGDTDRSPGPQRNFGLRLSSLGLERRRRGRGKHWWEGIKLTANEESSLEGRRNGAH